MNQQLVEDALNTVYLPRRTGEATRRVLEWRLVPRQTEKGMPSAAPPA